MATDYSRYLQYLPDHKRRLYEKGYLSDEDIRPDLEALAKADEAQYKAAKPTAPTAEGILAGPISPEEERVMTANKAYEDTGELSSLGAATAGVTGRAGRIGAGLYERGAQEVMGRGGLLSSILAGSNPVSAMSDYLGRTAVRGLVGAEESDKYLADLAHENELYKAEQAGVQQRIKEAKDKTNWLMGKAIELAPDITDIGVQIGGGLASRGKLTPLLASLSGIGSVGETYFDTEGTHGERALRSTVFGGAEGVLEKLPGGQASVRALSNVIPGIAKEATTEIATQQIQDAYDVASGNLDGLPKTFEDVLKRYGETGLNAALLGGAVSPISSRAEAYEAREKYTKELQDKFLKEQAARVGKDELDKAEDPATATGMLESDRIFKEETAKLQQDLFGTTPEMVARPEFSRPDNRDENIPPVVNTKTDSLPIDFLRDKSDVLRRMEEGERERVSQLQAEVDAQNNEAIKFADAGAQPADNTLVRTLNTAKENVDSLNRQRNQIWSDRATQQDMFPNAPTERPKTQLDLAREEAAAKAEAERKAQEKKDKAAATAAKNKEQRLTTQLTKQAEETVLKKYGNTDLRPEEFNVLVKNEVTRLREQGASQVASTLPNQSRIDAARAAAQAAKDKKAKSEDTKQRNLTEKLVQKAIANGATDAEIDAIYRGQGTAAPAAIATPAPQAKPATTAAATAEEIRNSNSFSVAAEQTVQKEGADPKAHAKILNTLRNLAHDTSNEAINTRKAILSGKIKVLANVEQLPEHVKADPRYKKAGGAFDGENVYVVGDKNLNKSDFIATAMHEVGHYYNEAVDTKAGPRSFNNIVGKDNNQRLSKIILAEAGKDNKVAQAAVRRWKAAGEDTRGRVDELLTYTFEEAQRAKERHTPLGSMRGVLNDAWSSAKIFMQDKLGKDFEPTVNDLAVLSRRMLKHVPTAKEKAGVVKAPSFSLVGPSALKAKEYEAKGRGFDGAVDKKRRYEIDTSQAQLKPDVPDEGSLEEFLDYQELYDNYPQLRGMRVSIESEQQGVPASASGAYMGPERGIVLNEKLLKSGQQGVRSTLLHELQHVIQDIEGFEQGGNPDMFRTEQEKQALSDSTTQMELLGRRITSRALNDLINKTTLGGSPVEDDASQEDKTIMLDGLVRQYNRKGTSQEIKDTLNSSAVFRAYLKASTTHDDIIKRSKESYRRLAGEAEARTVQTREDFSAKLREEIPFYESMEDREGLTEADLTSSPLTRTSGSFSIADDLDLTYSKNDRVGEALTLADSEKNSTKIRDLWHKTMSKISSDIPDDIAQGQERAKGEQFAGELEAVAAVNKVQKIIGSEPDQEAAMDMLNKYAHAPSREQRLAMVPEFEKQFPELYEAYNDLRKIVFNNSVLVSDKLRANKRQSKRDVDMADAIDANLGDYISRTYKLFGNAKLQEAHLEFLKKNDEGKAIVARAKDFVTKHIVSIPDNVETVGRDRLEALYDMYIGDVKDSSELDIDELREAIEDLKDGLSKEKLNLAADRVMDDLLAVGARSQHIGKGARLLRESKQDLTIITSKKDVPEAIRELWGEQKDPVLSVFNTIQRQGEFIAKIKEQHRLADKYTGKFFFDNPTEEETSNMKLTQLTGEAWGPLQNKWTTPTIKEFLDVKKTHDASLAAIRQAWRNAKSNPELSGHVTQEVISYLGKGLAKAGGLNKRMTVIFNPMNLAYNAMGTPIQAFSNGNFGFSKFVEGFKTAALKLPDSAYKTEASPEVLELIRNNLQDSALIGEIKDAEYNALISRLTKRSTSEQTKAAGRRVVEASTDVYSAADLFAKVANYYYEKDFIKKFNETLGKEMSEEEVQRVAAERIQQTNFSFNRAWKPARALEQAGVTRFLTYNAEVFRTIIGNFRLGFSDISSANVLAQVNPEAASMLRTHGIKRVVGASSSLGILAKGYSLGAIMLKELFGAADDESEEEKFIKKYGLPDYLSDSLPVLVDKNGTERTYFDVSRLDPYGPASELFRSLQDAAMEGDPNKIKDGIASLFILNKAAELALETVNMNKFDRAKLENRAPDLYNSIIGDVTKMGLPKWTGDQLIKVMENFMPSAVVTGVSGAAAPEEELAHKVAGMAGMSLIKYRPESDLALDAPNVIGKELNKMRQDWSNFISTQQVVDPDTIIDRFADYNEQEYKAWSKMRKKVQAALKAGVPTQQVKDQLKDGSINEQQRASLMSGRYAPAMLSRNKLDADKAEELKAAKKDAKKMQQINTKYRVINAEIPKLTRKYIELAKPIMENE